MAALKVVNFTELLILHHPPVAPPLPAVCSLATEVVR
jgi:hypothetical protein